MSLFLWLSLLAGAGWAVVSVIDDYITRQWKASILLLAVYAGLSRFFIIPPLAAVGAYTVPTVPAVLGSVFLGVLFFAGLYLYYRALKQGEIVSITVFSESGSLLVLVAAIILGTAVTLLDIFSVILMVAASTLVSMKQVSIGNLELRKETILVLLATVLFSSISIFADVTASAFQNNVSQLAWMWVGTAGSTVLYILASNNVSLPDIRENKEAILLFGVALIPESLAYIAYFEALRIGNVAVASGLSSIRPLFVLMFSLLIPRTQIRNVSRRRVVILIIAMIFVSIGGYLTQL